MMGEGKKQGAVPLAQTRTGGLEIFRSDFLNSIQLYLIKRGLK